jgi:hypothetical protein
MGVEGCTTRVFGFFEWCFGGRAQHPTMWLTASRLNLLWSPKVVVANRHFCREPANEHMRAEPVSHPIPEIAALVVGMKSAVSEHELKRQFALAKSATQRSTRAKNSRPMGSATP